MSRTSSVTSLRENMPINASSSKKKSSKKKKKRSGQDKYGFFFFYYSNLKSFLRKAINIKFLYK